MMRRRKTLDSFCQRHLATFHTSSRGLSVHKKGVRTGAQIQGDFEVGNIILLSCAFKEGCGAHPWVSGLGWAGTKAGLLCHAMGSQPSSLGQGLPSSKRLLTVPPGSVFLPGVPWRVRAGCCVPLCRLDPGPECQFPGIPR